MHMAFLSRGFKNLQWYSMTDKNLVTRPVTRFFLCLFWGKYPFAYSLSISRSNPKKSIHPDRSAQKAGNYRAAAIKWQ